MQFGGENGYSSGVAIGMSMADASNARAEADAAYARNRELEREVQRLRAENRKLIEENKGLKSEVAELIGIKDYLHCNSVAASAVVGKMMDAMALLPADIGKNFYDQVLDLSRGRIVERERELGFAAGTIKNAIKDNGILKSFGLTS